MLLDLFITFFMIGLVSFGGGYAMIPLIQDQVVNRHGWMELQHFSDIIAVAGMSPGPIATNIAVFIGYEKMGLLGAIIAMIGTILPSLIIILVLGRLFYKVRDNDLVKSSFYGLRAIITGLIIYTAIMFAETNGMLSSMSWYTWSQILIFLGSLSAFLFFSQAPRFDFNYFWLSRNRLVWIETYYRKRRTREWNKSNLAAQLVGTK